MDRSIHLDEVNEYLVSFIFFSLNLSITQFMRINEFHQQIYGAWICCWHCIFLMLLTFFGVLTALHFI